MGQSPRLRTMLRAALLVVSGLQGMTPDPSDLASMVLLDVLCPVAGEFRLGDQDETPDEFCVPLGCAAKTAPGHDATASARFLRSAIFGHVATCERDDGTNAGTPERMVPYDALIHLVCRLTC